MGQNPILFPSTTAFFSLANWSKILHLLWGGATITTRVLNSNLLNIVPGWGLGCQVAFSHNRSFVKFLLFRPKLFYVFDKFPQILLLLNIRAKFSIKSLSLKLNLLCNNHHLCHISKWRKTHWSILINKLYFSFNICKWLFIWNK